MNEREYLDHDWGKTPLGPMEEWTIPLTCWSSFLRKCAQPALLLWGEQRILLFNDAYADLLGDNYLKALGRRFDDLKRPEWRRLACYLEDGFRGNSGNFDDTEVLTWQQGGESTRYFSFSYTPISCSDYSPDPMGVFFAIVDRTEKIALYTDRQRQFERLHEIYEHAPGFIAMAEGPEHRFTFANAAYRDLVGDREIIGRTVAEVLPEITEQGFIAILDEVYSTGVPFVGRAIPIELAGPEGKPRLRYIDTIYHPVKDGHGRITGLFAEGHDVTEQVEAQTLAANLQAQLLRMSRSRAMESFGTAVAHEINQPLAAAVNYLGVATKLVGKPGEEAELADIIERAQAATLRSGEILRRLRNLSANVSSPQISDLEKIVIEAISLTRMANPELSIITMSLEPATVEVDPVQIQQVLVNLIRNAQEAMTGTPNPRIEITVSRTEDRAVVRVKDHGGGVEEDRISDLFDWFVTSKAEGTGIGLPISKRIIDAHQGRIWVENDDNGAVFSFSIPLASEPANV